MFADVFRLVIAIAMMVLIVRTGIAVMRSMVTPVTDPEAGELRRVALRYRCGICGTELRITLAPDEDPPPPRHCLEDMEIVAPIE